MSVPVKIIDNQDTCRKVLLHAGFSDLAEQIVGEGFAFTPVEGREFMGLVAAQKRGSEVQYRIFCVEAKHGHEAIIKAFTEIMENAAKNEGSPLRIELQDIGRN